MTDSKEKTGNQSEDEGQFKGGHPPHQGGNQPRRESQSEGAPQSGESTSSDTLGTSRGETQGRSRK